MQEIVFHLGQIVQLVKSLTPDQMRDVAIDLDCLSSELNDAADEVEALDADEWTGRIVESAMK